MITITRFPRDLKSNEIINQKNRHEIHLEDNPKGVSPSSNKKNLERSKQREMELSSLILASALFLLSFLCLILFLNINPRPPTTNTTIIRGYPIVGNLPRFIKNQHRIVEWSTELLASTASSTITLAPIIFTSNPEIVEHITKTSFDNYVKVEEISSAVEDFLGRGILNVNGDKWKLQRKMASYEFNPKSLRTVVFNNVRYEIDTRLIPFLREASNNGQVLDLQDVLERFAFDNICNLVLGIEPDCLRKRGSEGERFYRAFGEATKIITERGMKTPVSTWMVKRLLNIGSERRLKESIAFVHEFVVKSIKSRRFHDTRNFLSRLINDESLSDDLVRDILINFMVAGRDTTPTALTWFFWNLASAPDTVNKIHNEIELMRSLQSTETFNVDELKEMNYLHAAISESMRLYPPLPLHPKKCLGDDILPDDTPVRKGWIVMYSAYAMARKEGIWGEDCQEFKPERWLDEEGEFRARNAFEYPVFHAGPRVCLGKEMAYVQMKAVAASVLERFKVEVVEERGEFELGMTLRMRGGLPVRVKERRHSSR